MKKITSIMLLLITVISLASCNSSVIEPTNSPGTEPIDSFQPTLTPEPEIIDYKVYVQFPLESNLAEDDSSLKSLPLWEDPATYVYNFQIDGVATTKKFVFQGIEYEMNYGGTWHPYPDPKKGGGLYHAYSKNGVHAEFHAETGELVFFYTPSSLFKNGNVTQAEAIDIANKFIESKCGKEVLANYCEPTAEMDQKTNSYDISFERKKIEGIEVYASGMYVTVDKSGEIRVLSTQGIYSIDKEAAEKITKERLDAAEKALIATLPEGYTISEYHREIVYAPTSNTCYLRMMIAKPSNLTGTLCYINIF